MGHAQCAAVAAQCRSHCHVPGEPLKDATPVRSAFLEMPNMLVSPHSADRTAKCVPGEPPQLTVHFLLLTALSLHFPVLMLGMSSLLRLCGAACMHIASVCVCVCVYA